MAAREELEALLGAELAQPLLPGVARMAEAIRARHGEALVALLFYGSCLRRGTTEGVLDFYAVVERYRPAYRSPLPALAAALLPPNVHYLELPAEGLRAKYALISLADFARHATPASLDCRIWSRFCQPARIAWARDEETRAALAAVAADACATMAERMLCFAAGGGAERCLDPRELWAGAFRETYRAELRGEAPATIDAIAAADPARYARVLRAALAVLAGEGHLQVTAEPDGVLLVAQDPRAPARGAGAVP